MSHHIVVIGSGASGLMAAWNLAQQNHKVTLVEARDRIGGRIHTLTNKFSMSTEAGAEFIHGDQPLTMSLIQDSKSELSLLQGQRYQLMKGKILSSEFTDDQWNLLEDALQGLNTDMDMASFLNLYFKQDQYKDLRQRVKRFVEGYDAADLHRVSAMALKAEWSESDDEHQYHIIGGYARLIHYLHEKVNAAGVAIHLSSPVQAVQWSAGKVKVVTETGPTFEADKVVVTVPLGVLQKGSITFTPPLAEYQEAVNNIGFGGVIKFLFEFKDSFWEDRITRPLKDVAFIFSDAGVPTWWSQLPNKIPLLTGWLGGPSTYKTNHNQQALYEKATASLQYVFNCSAKVIKDEIKEWHIADWVEDPYACGAYAYATVETRKARTLLAQPVKDTIYFAGEAIYEGSAMGSVEAALVSGQGIAKKII